MIAVDTNVLLRRLLQDDEQQSAKANALFEQEASILITDVVLVETIWTLRGKKYRISKEDIVKTIDGLMAEPNIVFEHPQTVWATLSDYRKAKSVKVSGKTKNADFADALIVNKSKLVASRNETWLEAVFTFDLAALEIAGTETL